MAFWNKKKNQSEKTAEPDSLQPEAQEHPLETDTEQAPVPVESEHGEPSGPDADPGARPVEAGPETEAPEQRQEPESLAPPEPLEPELEAEPGVPAAETQKAEADTEPGPQTSPGPESEAGPELAPDQAETDSREADSAEEKPEPEPQPQKLGFWARRRQRLAAKVATDGQETAPPAPEPGEPSPKIPAEEPLTRT